MAYKRPDNNRSEGSGRPKKQFSDGNRTSGNDFSSRGRSSASGFKKDFNNDKPRRSYGDSPAGEVKRFASSGSKPYSKRASGGFERDGEPSGERKRPYSGRPDSGDRPQKTYGDRPAKSFGDRPKKSFGDRPAGKFDDRPKKSFGDRPDRGGEGRGDRSFGDKPRKSFGDRPERSGEGRGEKSFGDRPRKSFGDRPERSEGRGDRNFGDKPRKSFGDRPDRGGDRPAGKFGDRPKRDFNKGGDGDRKFGDRPARREGSFNREDRPERDRRDDNYEKPERVMRGRKNPAKPSEDKGLIRLNRYISNAGICSRRKADELIAAGVVSVNGEVVSELGHKVDPSVDVIRYNGETLKREKMVYVLLNKPKDYITTTDDPQERRTVMHLVDKASKERIYPIGRLDRNTTGLLLMTNDGDLADKLSHPKNNITKLYQVELSKNLTQGDLNKIGFGIELEDGFIKPDSVSFVAGGTKREVGIQIHSGKNRIVRRIFESLGYEVVKLDRVVYANLTKKDLPRGRWRYLNEEEVIQLKHLI